MRPAHELLPNAVRNKGILQGARAWKVLENWDEVVGPILAEKCWPERFEKGTVYIAVIGAAWVQELRLQQEIFLKRLQSFSPDPNLIQGLRFSDRAGTEKPTPGNPVKKESSPPQERVLSLAEINELAKKRIELRDTKDHG